MLGAVAAAGVFTLRQKSALATKMSLDSDDIYWLTGRAWLGAICDAEGFANYGAVAYQTAYRYKPFTGFDDHPRSRAESPIPETNSVSDASGPYQIISTTWDKCHQKHPDIWLDTEPAFSPANQDRCALALSWDAGGHRHLMAGTRVLNGHLRISYSAFKQAVYADSIEWASFPGHDIGAATGQNTKPLWFIWSAFQWHLWKQLGYRRHVHPVLETIQVTSYIGPRWGQLHQGIDLAAAVGDPIFAPERCSVVKVTEDKRSGKYAVISPIHFPELQLSLCHLSECWVKAGDVVEAGDVIALAGATGTVTGPHLHVGMWVGDDANGWGLINPYYYLMMSQWY